MQNASIHTKIPYNSGQNCKNRYLIYMILINSNYSCSSYVWMSVAFVLVLGSFSIHYMVVRKFFDLVWISLQLSLNLVWFFVKNESELSLIFCFLSLISIVGGLLPCNFRVSIIWNFHQLVNLNESYISTILNLLLHDYNGP